jgi:hypothetical protein
MCFVPACYMIQMKTKDPPKHPFNVRIWNRLKKIKQAVFLINKFLTPNPETEGKGAKR